MQKVNILGINVDKISNSELLQKIYSFLDSPDFHYIVTPNPEIILEGITDEEEFFILNRADIAIPDGMGLKIAALLCAQKINRITGADLTEDILKMADKDGKKVAIINWKNSLSKNEEIEKKVKLKFPNLQISIIYADRDYKKFNFKELDKFKPQIVFVALGAPYQEKFIYNNLRNKEYVKVAIGVGGSFDFLTCKVKRAPKLLRKTGLEWLWRLMKQPKRWKRIWNATFVFLTKFLKWRFILPLCYRKNVACILYKKIKDKYYILIVERSDFPGHWQLPQGGIDGENIKLAGIRELSEELNISKNDIMPIKFYKNLYKYSFKKIGKELTNKGEKYKKTNIGYKGQKQSLLIAEYLGSDSEIKINYWDHQNWKWIKASSLVYEVAFLRKPSAQIFYQKFKELKEKNII